MGDEYDIEEDDLDADLDEEDEDEDDEAEEETAAAAPSNPNRLDPALFASAFARKGDARAAAILRGQGQAQGQGNVDKAAEKRAARKEARRRKVRKGGVVQGRDGMPMRRLKDGRTIVRALESTPSSTVSAPASAGAEQFVEPALPYVPLDPSLSLPNKRARAFKKRRLQLQRSTSSSGTSSSSSSSSANKKAKAATKNWDDPLGLADPEFMPGGKFAMKGAVPRTPRSEQEQNGRAKRKRAGRRGEGGRVDGEYGERVTETGVWSKEC